MKILNNSVDLKSGNGDITLIATTPDDFYCLSLIIVPNDKIESVTTRKVSFDGGKTQQKIVCKLEVKTESISADLEDGLLYVKGKISKEHDHITTGCYHTLSIPLEQKFKISKDNWTHTDLKSIKDATIEAPELCFIIFFEKDCVVSISGFNSIKILSKHDPKSKNFKNISNGISGIKNKIKTFVIASTSEIRNEYHKSFSKDLKHLNSHVVVLKLTNEYKNISNSKAISRILTDKNFSTTFSEVKYVEDLKEIAEFFLKMEKQDPTIFFGETEVKEAFDYGAVKTLFITDELYRPKTVEERKKTELIIKDALALRAKICVVPIVHENGEKLKGLGGIAGVALFLYKQ